MPWTAPGFAHSLGLALSALELAPGSESLALADDPLRLDLPPIVGSARRRIAGTALETLAALYLAAELEQLGVVPVAELLVEERASLRLRSVGAAELLESFAQRSDQWYSREQRERLYARVFGVGRFATHDPAVSVNQDFTRLLASLCSAVVAYSEYQPADRQSMRLAVAVEHSAEQLLNNLSHRQHGSTLVAATPIGAQLRAAMEILDHDDMVSLVGGQSLWDVVSFVLQESAPDMSRLLARGQAGQIVLLWLAGQSDTTPTVTFESSQAAVQWLIASGFDPPTSLPFAV